MRKINLIKTWNSSSEVKVLNYSQVNEAATAGPLIKAEERLN